MWKLGGRGNGCDSQSDLGLVVKIEAKTKEHKSVLASLL